MLETPLNTLHKVLCVLKDNDFMFLFPYWHYNKINSSKTHLVKINLDNFSLVQKLYDSGHNNNYFTTHLHHFFCRTFLPQASIHHWVHCSIPLSSDTDVKLHHILQQHTSDLKKSRNTAITNNKNCCIKGIKFWICPNLSL